jgi:hypothetical protein
MLHVAILEVFNNEQNYNRAEIVSAWDSRYIDMWHWLTPDTILSKTGSWWVGGKTDGRQG